MKPEKVFRIGLISASIFNNEVDTEGGSRKVRSVNMQRRYRDQNDEWKTASTFGLADLPLLGKVVELATDYITSKEADVTNR